MPLALTLAGLLVAIVAYIGFGVYKVLVIDRAKYARYWRVRRHEALGPEDIHLVALGDSTVQAVGASTPLLGTVGRVAEFIEQETGRKVHVDNVSIFGAKAVDVVEQQLAKIDTMSADIIMVAVGANDAIKASNLDTFRASIQKIVSALPPEKTVMADVAMVRGRGQYQSILHELRSERGTYRADIGKTFRDRVPRRPLAARDFFHPNNYGYTYWFAAFKPAIRQLIADRHLAK